MGVTDGIWQLGVQYMGGGVSKTLEFDPESETCETMQLGFDGTGPRDVVAATLRHIKTEKFKQHRSLRRHHCSDEYSVSDSGRSVLLAVFECRGMTPVTARLPLTVEDDDGCTHDATQLNDGHWFRMGFYHDEQ